MNQPVIGVLVVNYFGHESVARLCASLVQHRGEATLVISVVDNSQDHDEFNRLEGEVVGLADVDVIIHLERSDENRGYAGGNNRAWEAIADRSVDVVLVTNPDAEIVDGDLENFAREISEESYRLVGSRTIQDGQTTIGLSLLNRATARSQPIPLGERVPDGALVYPDGHFLAMTSATWRAVGGFSENYFLYAEEVDLTLRLRRLHPEAVVLASVGVTVRHVGGESTSDDGGKSSVTFLHGTRSRVILYRSHRALRAFLPVLIVVRTIWAGVLAVRGRTGSAKSVLRGLRRGMMDQVGQEERSWS